MNQNLFKVIIRLNISCHRRFFSYNVLKSSESDILVERDKKLRAFYKDLFELTEKQSAKVFVKKPYLLFSDIDTEQVTQSFNFLRSMNFTKTEILAIPKVLRLEKTDLMETKKILEEFCFHEMKLKFFLEFSNCMEEKVRIYKARNMIAADANVKENILKILDIKYDKFSAVEFDNMSLREIRKLLCRHYFEEKFLLKSPKIDNILKGRKIKRRSFAGIVKTVNILQYQLDICLDDIVKYGLYRACPHNLQQIIDEFPSIAGKHWKTFLLKEVTLVLKNYRNVKEKIENIKNFGYTEEHILRFPKILTRTCDRVYNDLLCFQKHNELKVLGKSPKVLLLVSQQQKAAARMEFLRKMEVKDGSFSRLTSPNDDFEKYIRDGCDITKGNDLTQYLSQVFKKEESELKKIIKRHPYWREIPLADVVATINYLRYKKFTNKEISENFFLLLYPVSQIELKLLPLIEKNSRTNQVPNESQQTPSRTKLLKVCLYQIELDYHFTGDGVWDRQRAKSMSSIDSNLDSEEAWKLQKAANSL